MRQSRLFGKTLREDPKGEVSKNARLLERGGFVHKTMSGVYDYLPLGLRALDNINRIIREEMNAIGGQEMLLSSLQPKERWQKTGRWGGLEEIMYRVTDNSGREMGLAPTHEEAVAEIASRSIFSHKDLPLFAYQIQTKFRDEPRAKSGLIRGREFLMKDLYSFHADEKNLETFYKKAKGAYMKVFARCGLKVFITEASGGTFTKNYSHEFQALSDAGEDWLLYCGKCGYAQNKEISKMGAGHSCPKCGGKIAQGRSIEVGNIFKLGTKFSEALGLLYADALGEKKPVVMGSYGIGPGRLLAAVVEAHSDERGIIWPDEVAPFSAHLIKIKSQKSNLKNKVGAFSEKLYKDLIAMGAAVLYDDREEKSAGEKFADADLIGIPWRIVASERSLEKKSVEAKRRNAKEPVFVKLSRFGAFVKKELLPIK